MNTPFRRVVAVALLAAATLLASCGADTAPPAGSPAPSAAASAAASVDAAVNEAQRTAYNEAICPLFTALVDLDPRLAALREVGAGGDLSGSAAELDAVSTSMLSVLDALDAVPHWAPGTELRFNLISSLHVIRTQLLIIAEEPSTAESAELLAMLPFVASEAMDRSMNRAIEGGMSCEGIE
jgi:hypothetical protein